MIVLTCFAALALSTQMASIGLVLLRKSRPDEGKGVDTRPPVTLLRPICGLENNLERTLTSSFELDWPDYEVIFCAASADDPAIEVARRCMVAHPGTPARILVGEEQISVNPKLNNVIKGWRSARHDWIAMIDSNVLMPRDQFIRMFARWDDRTGLVCAPPIGTEPIGMAATLESSWLNSFQARWQLVADACGFGFAQGKAMLFNRQIMTGLGGLERLGEEVAEDAAATALIRAGGLKVRLVRQPFPQPLGPRSLSAVWKRQLRWARLRRVSFPLCFLPEFLVGGLFPMAAVAALIIAGTWSPMLALAYGLAWYGSEAALCRSFGWPSGRRAVAAMLLRDLLLPALWAAAWFGNGFVWRGNAMTVGGQTAPATGRGRLHHALARTRDKARQKARALAAFRPS